MDRMEVNMNMASEIAVTVLVRNSEDSVGDCLRSLSRFPEVVVLDTGSTDRTVAIASIFPNARVFRTDFKGFGPAKNLAASYAERDWILNIDSDEIVTEELAEEILTLELEENKIYDIPRDNYYNERLIRCCGWSPDRVLRLYNRKATTFGENLVHESVTVEGPLETVHLRSPLRHYSFRTAGDLLDKMQRYAALYALQNRGVKKSSPSRAFFHAFAAFLKNYFLQWGFLYGGEGLLISVSNAGGVFYKYIMLYEANKK